MFDCQGQLLSFLYLGRSDDDRFTFPGKKVEKVVAETGSLQWDFNKDIFCKSGEKTMSVHTCRLSVSSCRKRLFQAEAGLLFF